MCLASAFASHNYDSYLDLRTTEALTGLDLAIDCLFEHSEFRSAGRELFQLAVEGKRTSEQLDTIHQLTDGFAQSCST